jgi:polyisoprenoid-binding protein YceI
MRSLTGHFVGRNVGFVICVCLGLCVAGASAQAGSDVWHLDPAHSAAQFSVRHMGISTVRGTFTKLRGDVTYSPSDPTHSTIDVTIDASSVDTRVEMRDNDVRGPHFLDAAKYPVITFKSKHVEDAGAGHLKVTGDLTIHRVTKEVVLDVEGPTGPMTGQMGGPRMGASATTKINREDFGVGGSSAMVGDEVQIVIDEELVQHLGHPGGPKPPTPPGQ